MLCRKSPLNKSQGLLELHKVISFVLFLAFRKANREWELWAFTPLGTSTNPPPQQWVPELLTHTTHEVMLHQVSLKNHSLSASQLQLLPYSNSSCPKPSPHPRPHPSSIRVWQWRGHYQLDKHGPSPARKGVLYYLLNDTTAGFYSTSSTL